MNNATQVIVSIMLACVPALIWGYIFYKKHPKNRNIVILTFAVGALAVFPILFYKFLWQFFPWINAFKLADYYQNDLIGFSNFMIVPLSVIITFMFVGLIEEVMKMLSVKVADDDEIKSVDDAIEFFIIAALGFSFTENILYFYNIWISQGASNLFMPFLFRSTFSTFAHLMFSGILGYYYGTAHFAKPILQEELKAKRKQWVQKIHNIFHFKKEGIFYKEIILEGLLISIGLHAIFNIILEMNLNFLIVPFLVGGYRALNYLFKKKENHKEYGKVLVYVRNHPHPKTGVYFERNSIKKDEV
jgi:RsiW-degrading membrane proteinase PrsW (M82 family)